MQNIDLLTTLLAANIWFVLMTPFRRKIPNPVLVRCMACGAKMHLRAPGAGGYISNVAAQFILWLCVWRLNPPFLVGMGMLLILAFPLVIAMGRIYHAYWRWRHPLRCDGGGHIVPAPSKA